jgi:hypothetical protein
VWVSTVESYIRLCSRLTPKEDHINLGIYMGLFPVIPIQIVSNDRLISKERIHNKEWNIPNSTCLRLFWDSETNSDNGLQSLFNIIIEMLHNSDISIFKTCTFCQWKLPPRDFENEYICSFCENVKYGACFKKNNSSIYRLEFHTKKVD